MVPYKAGKANEGHSCVKGRFAYGYATHKDRIIKPMIRAKITDPWREVSLGRGGRLRRERIQAHPGEIRPRLDRRDHFLALHQRGSVPGPEAGARRLRQQQRRHLRARLPLADRLWPQPGLRHVRGHAGFQVGRQVRRDPRHRRQSDRRASGVRLADEEAAARRRQADRRRSAPHRSRAHAACRGRASSGAAAGHECRRRQRARACRSSPRASSTKPSCASAATAPISNPGRASSPRSGIRRRRSRPRPASTRGDVRAAARLFAKGGNGAIYYGLGVTEHSARARRR